MLFLKTSNMICLKYESINEGVKRKIEGLLVRFNIKYEQYKQIVWLTNT